jgi:hypothetical protein
MHRMMPRTTGIRRELKKKMQNVLSVLCGLLRATCSSPRRARRVSAMQRKAEKSVRRRWQKNMTGTQGVYQTPAQRPLARLQPQPSKQYEDMGRLRLATPLRGPVLQLLTATPRRAPRRTPKSSTPLKDTQHPTQLIHHGPTNTKSLIRALLKAILIR